eukprot:2732916-Pleurochrysis_carterae.AAC.1
MRASAVSAFGVVGVPCAGLRLALFLASVPRRVASLRSVALGCCRLVTFRLIRSLRDERTALRPVELD